MILTMGINQVNEFIIKENFMGNRLLTINDLKVNIDDKEILKGLNLIINEGEIHVIMGPNGGENLLLPIP